MTLADKLKASRELAGFSQAAVAEELNISRQSISKWENGRGYPDIDNLVLLSQMYEVSIDELLKENEALQNKISENETEITAKRQRLNVIKETIRSDKDEGLILLLLAAISALLFPLGLLVIPFIIVRNKKTNTLYKLVYVICFCTLVINIFNFVDVSTDNLNIPWGETMIEKID